MADKVDPFDVEALEKSLNDSATRVSTIWISFLTFGLYLVTAAGTITHRQLFLEEPVKLPVLKIDLPLVGFFLLAPILFVIFHAYVLLQVLLLGRTAAAYNEVVEKAQLGTEENASIRQRLANTLFAQIFAGSPRERDGWLGLLLKTMAWITLAVAPVLILLFFQFQFLPYHNPYITWTHRLLVPLELLLVVTFWPLALDETLDMNWHHFFKLWRSPAGLVVLVLYLFVSFLLLSFPGEPHAEWTRYWPDEKSLSKAPKFGDGLQCRTRSRVSWVFPHFDRLYLPRVDVVDDEALKKIEVHTKATGEPDYQGERTRQLRNRDFNCADFSDYADLRRVDLTGTSMRGARLDRSKLQGASLGGAQLQGASLPEAQLQGASLHFAQLQGAFLILSQFQSASLDEAQLQGASLDGAQLQGASLYRAALQGARLGSSALQGVSLVEAQLQGASLNKAQLQGAMLLRSRLTQAVLVDSYIWRARTTDCEGARVLGNKSDDIVQFKFSRYGDGSIPATAEAAAKFIEEFVNDVRNVAIKKNAADRMRAGLIVDPAKDDTAAIQEVWRKCEEASARIPQAEFDKKHAAFLRDLVCNEKYSRDAPAKGIIRNWISDRPERHAFSAQLARGLLGEDGKPCAATADLDEADIRKLRAAIAAAPSPPAPTTTTSPPAAGAPAPPSNAAPAARAAPSPAPTSSPSPK